MPAWLYSIILICWVCLLAPLSAGAAGLSHTAPQWQTLGRGLSFAQVDVLREGEVTEVVASLAVVKIDPATNAFRVFHQAPQSITEWQQQLKAPIVFNASFYGHNNQPVGLIIADGQAIGSPNNRQMRGMFVAEPKGISPDLPRATILDLLATPINPRNLPWTQGVQSFPLLLDYKGNIRVRDSNKRSNRTVIATDRVGNILVFNTSNRFFTLRELAQFLKNSKFGIDSALNLDGGTEAQLLIKTNDLEFFSPPSWENSLGNILDQKIYWLPTVVGVFPASGLSLMARYLILGAGKFGRLALARLARQEAAASFQVVEHRPEALAAARALAIPEVEWVAAEAIAFLAANLHEEPPWDWLIPMVPVHVACAWLLAGPLNAWETAAVPEELEQLAPVWFRGPEGQLYLSRAAHLCPDDCPEPDSVCPVSGESREAPLYAELAAVNLPGWSTRVIPSRQLAPGVGGYPPEALLALGRELAGLAGKVLVATACRCHGVVHGIKR